MKRSRSDASICNSTTGSSSSADAPTFAICTITKDPHRFERWLDYYRDLGASHVFLRVEKTPEVDALVAQEKFAAFVTVTQAPQQANPYDSLMKRQALHTTEALEECARRGVDWLFHVDDDELLHFGEPWESVVARVPPSADCIVVRNLEAVPDSEQSDFTTISRFAHADEDGEPFLAYINGKAGGRVGRCTEDGPHRFTGEEWEAPPCVAAVLHFESCPYTRWRDKFVHYGKLTSEAKLKTIPFPFYVDSIRYCREHAADDARLRAWWRRRKMRYYAPFADQIETIEHLALSKKRRRSPRFLPDEPLSARPAAPIFRGED